MKRSALILSAILISIAGVQHAYAHAQVTSSFPGKNQSISTIPSFVWVEFDGDLLQLGEGKINRITVTNSKKLRVDIGGSIVGGARISTKVKTSLVPGRYVVSYRVVSEDGHPVEGSYSFTLKAK